MLKVAVGHSTNLDSLEAIADVLHQCRIELAAEKPIAGILVAAIDFDHELILNQVMNAFPGLELVGGTTDGEISSVLGFEQDSLSLMLFCSDRINIRAGIGMNVSGDVAAATHNAVAQAKAGNTDSIQFCIALPESLTTSAVQIVEHLKQSLGHHVPIFGGLTADQWRFQKTYQFFQNRVCSDAVAVLLFSGPILFSHGIANGWLPIGKQGRITQVVQNVVHTIDKRPAIEFYRYYIGSLAPSSEYPLAVFNAEGNFLYMRAPNGLCNSESGSIGFFGDFPEGAVVQLTQATRNDILAASQESVHQAIQNYPGQCPSASLLFSCASRRQVLGSRTCEEYQLIKLMQDGLLRSLPCFGFYTNGEIAPLQRNGVTYFHNETFVTMLLGDS